MLEITWALGCVVIGILCWIKSENLDNDPLENDDGSGVIQWAISGTFAHVAAVGLSAKWIVIPLYVWFVDVVPDPASSLNAATAGLLTGIVCFAYVMAGGLAPTMTMHAIRTRRKNRLRSRQLRAV